MRSAEILIACPKINRSKGHDFLSNALKLSEVLVEHYSYILDESAHDCFILIPADSHVRIFISDSCDFIHNKISEYSRSDSYEINKSIIFTSNKSQCYLEALYSYIKFSKKIFISNHTKITVLTRASPYVTVDYTNNKERFVNKIYMPSLGINKLYVREDEEGREGWPYSIKKRFMRDLINEHSYIFQEPIYIFHYKATEIAEELERKISFYIPGADIRNKDVSRSGVLYQDSHLSSSCQKKFLDAETPKVLIFLFTKELFKSSELLVYFCEAMQAHNAIIIDSQGSSLKSLSLSELFSENVVNFIINHQLDESVYNAISQFEHSNILELALRSDVFFTIQEESKVIARVCQLCSENLKSYTATGGVNYKEGSKVLDILSKENTSGSEIHFHRSDGAILINSY